jgi:GTP cyclohydrolase II
MKMMSTSTWAKRQQFCGGAVVFGTQCYYDEITEVVHCNCTKEDNLKGFKCTIIFYLFQMVYNKKNHLVDLYTKDKSNRIQEQVWQDLSNRFNAALKFVKEDDVKNGSQLKDFMFLACGKLNIRIIP